MEWITKSLFILLHAVISLVLTFFLAGNESSVIDSILDAPTLLTLLAFGLTMLIFINGIVQEIKKNVLLLQIEPFIKKRMLLNIDKYYGEISSNIKVIFIAFFVSFAAELFLELPILSNLHVYCLIGVITKASLVFFIKCLFVLLTLHAVYDIFSSIKSICELHNEIK